MSKPIRDMSKENIGWLQVTFMIVLFPALFFFCVFLPMWAGWVTR